MAGSVIVPLYVFPSLGAWNPVFDLAGTYPRVHFTAIVNIQSGPGDGALPTAEYWDAIGTLNSFQNVRTIGYVSTAWCERNLSAVLDEVATYSFWGEYDSSLAMQGIFVDETPTQYSSEYIQYLENISQAVHSSPGLRDSYIVHNPGALPQPEFFQDPTIQSTGTGVGGPDLTVIFENSLANWSLQSVQLTEMTKLYDPEKLALLLHSVPELDPASTEVVLRQLLAVGHSIWLTGTNNYTDLDDHFPSFVECLANLLDSTTSEAEAESAIYPKDAR